MTDSVVIIIGLIAFVIAAISVGLIISAFNTSIQASDVPQVAKDNAASLDSNWGPGMDWLFAALLIGLPLVSMGLAHMNYIPSVFFYMILAFMLLMTIVAWGLQSGWESIISQGGIVASYAINQMPIANFVLSHLGIYTLLIITIIGYGTYVKQDQGGRGY